MESILLLFGLLIAYFLLDSLWQEIENRNDKWLCVIEWFERKEAERQAEEELRCNSPEEVVERRKRRTHEDRNYEKALTSKSMKY